MHRFLTAVLLMLAALTRTASAEDQELTVYSATDAAAIAGVIAGFEAANPSIDVTYVEYNTSELHAAVLAAQPGEIDLVISSAMDLQVDLVNRGLAQAYRPTTAALLPDWASWRDELWGFTFEPIVVAYNRAAFATRPLPRTRSELASQLRDDPEFFNDRIGTYDIALSGVGYLFATQDARRGVQFPRLLESLGRGGVRTFCCTTDIVREIAEGRLVLGYNVIGTYALDFAARDPRLGLYMLEDYGLVMSRTIFIAKSSRNGAAARRFVEFLLSTKGQALIGESGGLIPLLDGQTTARSADLEALVQGRSLFPIRLGPGLLTYLDASKRGRFLADWSASILPGRDKE